MGEFTKYPNKIDTTTELPKSTDNVTPVKAEVVNRQRDALLAIESELGIKPSGTHSTVRARLDAIVASSGAGGAISVAQNVSVIESQATTLTFRGAVSITAGAPHQAIIDIPLSEQKHEKLTVATNGQASFSLAKAPLQSNATVMYVNGLKQTYGSDYTVSGSTASYGGLSLTTSDTVEFWYIYHDAGALQSDITQNIVGVTLVTTSPYSVLTTDFHLSVTTTSIPITITLPLSPVVGFSMEIKDAAGNASVNNITINGNGYNLDGASSFTIDTNYQCITIRFVGTRWSIV